MEDASGIGFRCEDNGSTPDTRFVPVWEGLGAPLPAAGLRSGRAVGTGNGAMAAPGDGFAPQTGTVSPGLRL